MTLHVEGPTLTRVTCPCGRNLVFAHPAEQVRRATFDCNYCWTLLCIQDDKAIPLYEKLNKQLADKGIVTDGKWNVMEV